MYSKVKRVADAAISAFLLVTLAPVFAGIFLLVRWDTPGSSVFVQSRAGQNGQPFVIYKFRTMRIEAPHNVAASALKHPERYITRVGRFLRRTSLDELPQLINVLKGDMSLIGPRPVVFTEHELLRLRHAEGADRVRPGISGLAQVCGRDTLTVREKAYYDAWYAHHMSLRLDLHIVWLTVRCILADSHAPQPLS